MSGHEKNENFQVCIFSPDRCFGSIFRIGIGVLTQTSYSHFVLAGGRASLDLKKKFSVLWLEREVS